MRLLHIVPVLALAACTNSTPTAPVGREFKMAVGETTAISGTGLVVTFVRVAEDSRCPMGVQCIQAGNGQVELRVTLNGISAMLALNTTIEPRAGVIDNHHITLTELAPHPNVANPPLEAKDYRATLLVSLRTTNDVVR